MSMGEQTLSSWVSDVLNAMTDYRDVALENDDLEIIVDELVGSYQLDESDIEREINRRLLAIGYTYNDDDCVWGKLN